MSTGFETDRSIAKVILLQFWHIGKFFGEKMLKSPKYWQDFWKEQNVKVTNGSEGIDDATPCEDNALRSINEARNQL